MFLFGSLEFCCSVKLDPWRWLPQVMKKHLAHHICYLMTCLQVLFQEVKPKRSLPNHKALQRYQMLHVHQNCGFSLHFTQRQGCQLISISHLWQTSSSHGSDILKMLHSVDKYLYCRNNCVALHSHVSTNMLGSAKQIVCRATCTCIHGHALLHTNIYACMHTHICMPTQTLAAVTWLEGGLYKMDTCLKKEEESPWPSMQPGHSRCLNKLHTHHGQTVLTRVVMEGADCTDKGVVMKGPRQHNSPACPWQGWWWWRGQDYPPASPAQPPGGAPPPTSCAPPPWWWAPPCAGWWPGRRCGSWGPLSGTGASE